RVEFTVDSAAGIGIHGEDLREMHPAGAQKLEAVEARTGERPLVGEHHPLVEPPQADAADESLAGVLPSSEGEDLMVAIESGPLVAAEDPLPHPAAQFASSVLVLL